MNSIELNHIDLNSIWLNSKIINGVGKSHGGKVKPYIAGHIIDGSSTFTFKVNGNNVTVPVDANGNWKWVQDRDITSLANWLSYQKTSNDYIEFYLPRNPNLTSLYFFLYATNTQNNQQHSDMKVVIKALDTSNVVNMEGAFKNGRQIDMDYLPKINTAKCKNFYTMLHSQWVEYMDLRGFDMSSSEGNTASNGISGQWNYMQNTKTLELGDFFGNPSNNGCTPFGNSNSTIVNITARTIRISVNWSSMSKLTEQSVVNIFNAVAADGITLTFHATVFAMIEQQLEIEGSPIYEAYWNSDYDFNYASA